MTTRPKNQFLTNDIRNLPFSERNKSCERWRTKDKSVQRGTLFTYKNNYFYIARFFNICMRNVSKNHISQAQIGKSRDT
jgi:hypothetical protein